MTISEQSRHELYTRLQDALGGGAAATLMEHLPPVGWLGRRGHQAGPRRPRCQARAQAPSLENRLLATFRVEMSSLQRAFILALVGSNSGSTLTAAGFAFAAARLV